MESSFFVVALVVKYVCIIVLLVSVDLSLHVIGRYCRSVDKDARKSCGLSNIRTAECEIFVIEQYSREFGI